MQTYNETETSQTDLQCLLVVGWRWDGGQGRQREKPLMKHFASVVQLAPAVDSWQLHSVDWAPGYAAPRCSYWEYWEMLPKPENTVKWMWITNPKPITGASWSHWVLLLSCIYHVRLIIISTWRAGLSLSAVGMLWLGRSALLDPDILLSSTPSGVILPELQGLGFLSSALPLGHPPTPDPRPLSCLSWALSRSFCRLKFAISASIASEVMCELTDSEEEERRLARGRLVRLEADLRTLTSSHRLSTGDRCCCDRTEWATVKGGGNTVRLKIT